MGCNASAPERVRPHRAEPRHQDTHHFLDEERPVVYIPDVAQPSPLHAESEIHYSPNQHGSPIRNKEARKKLVAIPETDIYKPHEKAVSPGHIIPVADLKIDEQARPNLRRGTLDEGHVAQIPSKPGVSFRQTSPTNAIVRPGTTASQLFPPNTSQKGTFHDNYTLIESIGKGSFAEVYACIETASQKKWAVKFIKNRKKMLWNGRDALVDELVTLEKLRSAPNVVFMHDHFVGSNTCYVVLELLPGKNLMDRLVQHGTLSERDARKCSQCILDALKYIHERRVAHRDLKPENILLVDATNLYPVKLSDFGFSKTLARRNDCRTLCGTAGYMAPEILERWPAYDVKVDVWSFGVMLFLLLGGYLPFDSHGDNAVRRVFERTRRCQLHFCPKRWHGISQPAKALVCRCLTVDPNQRLSAEDASSYSWIKQQVELEKQRSSTVVLAESVNQANHGETHVNQMQRAQLLHDAVSSLHSDSIVSQFLGRVPDSSNASLGTTTICTSPEDSSSGKLFSDSYRKRDRLDQWGFATMYSCTHKQTGMPYALKEVEKTRMNDRELARLKEEIDVLLFLRGGPHILRLIDVFHETNTTLMILEETKGGNLLHRIVAREDYSEREARQICKALFHAVSFCHKKRIAHRDIKLDNLLLQENGSETSLKLTGFYSSKKVGNVPLTTMCGTPTYVAPEVFMALHGGYDFRCDMWSVGVVVYVLMVGYFPFEGADAVAIAQKVCQKTVHFHPEYWKQVSDSVQTLTRGLLERNVQTRLSADDALKSRWIQMEDDGVLATAELSGTKSKLGELCSIADTHSSGLSGTNDFKPEEGFDSIVVDDDSQSLDIRDVHTDDIDIDHSGFVNVDELYGEEATVKKIVRRDLAPEKLIALNDEIEVLRTIATCDDAAVAETMIQLRSVHEDINATYLVFAKLHGELLSERLQRQTKLQETEARVLVASLLSGISYCHSKYIAIRNLTLGNLLSVVRERDRTERITITDFALSKRIVFKNTLHTLCGTLEFVAPEMLQNVLAYDVECDMWAVGVILYMMLSGHHPFDVGSEHNRGNPQEELLKRIRYGDYAFPLERCWSKVSLEAKSLLERLMKVNPKERLTASEALSDVWIVR